jgi:hypothetical protein
MNPGTMKRTIACTLVAALLTGIAACGGGGGGSSPGATMGNVPTAPASAPSISAPVANTPAAGTPAADTPSASTSTATNSGSPTGPSATPTSSTVANTVPVVVSATQFNRVNAPMTSVTVCSAGTGASLNCTTIDNVLVDTESFGLRLFASAVPSTTLGTLNPQTQTSSGAAIAECALFGSGYSWGTVRNADIRMAGEVAQNVPIQVMSDPALTATAPDACRQQPFLGQPTDLGANGILGVGVAPQDCGSQCVFNSPAGEYYACSGATCQVADQALSWQVSNPVQYFAADNNGVVLEMPPVGATGAASAVGTLVFGIDTQSNNTLAGSGATVLATDLSGDFNATYNGAVYNDTAYFDSGSSVLFFQDADIGANGLNYYIPGTTLARSVSIAGNDLVSATVDFSVANANALFATRNAAFNNMAFDLPGAFDMGMPFFYGRHVFYGIVGTTSTGGGRGPYVAFTSS